MKKIKNSEVFNYHIFPPFIDAYLSSFSEGVTLKEIEDKMKSHASEWGEEVVGKTILNGRELPKFDDKIVLCCAYLYKLKDSDSLYTRHKEYLIVIDNFCNDWFDKLEFIEGEVTQSWDVT